MNYGGVATKRRVDSKAQRMDADKSDFCDGGGEGGWTHGQDRLSLRRESVAVVEDFEVVAVFGWEAASTPSSGCGR
jgi:hypothetical protein